MKLTFTSVYLNRGHTLSIICGAGGCVTNGRTILRRKLRHTSLDRVCACSRGGTIHRCIDISRYFSCDTYRDIIFYNHDLFFVFF